MKKVAKKAEVEQLILDELRTRFPDVPIEGVGLVMLPDKWNVVVVSNGQPCSGDVLDIGMKFATTLRDEYEVR